jgi:hypothetical protein
MSTFYSAEEAIRLRTLGNEDYQERDKMRLLSWAKHVFNDMNLNVIRIPVRKRVYINKRTNSIDLPCSATKLASINIEDECGNEYPVYRNDRILEDTDIVDVTAAKNCACEHECGHYLCNTIKGYVATIETVEDKNPDGTTVSFECISRKGVDDQGFFYEQLQYPKRIYEDGVWTETILYTEDRKLCKVEVDENGCVCDTEENVEAVCNACGVQNVNQNYCSIGGNASEPPNDSVNTWIYYCANKMEWFGIQCGKLPTRCFNNTYSVSSLGNRIIFPANFGFDSVIARWYEVVDLKNIQIPIIAVPTFVVGCMWWDCRFNDKKQGLAKIYSKNYADLKFGLLKDMNKYRVAVLAEIVAPPKYVPSYINGYTNKTEGNNNDNYL